MEFNNPSQIVKDLHFGSDAREKVISGVTKLTSAVKSTLGASGHCVVYEDAMGRPVITKDGVTVAESVVLYDPVENIGATLIKEAAKNTVKEAGDGTTTATVLAHSLLTIANQYVQDHTVRELKDGIYKAQNKVLALLDKNAIDVNDGMLNSVATISCNNDAQLGAVIGEAYARVGKDGVVLMEESETEETYVEFVDGAQIESGLKSQHLATDKDKGVAVLDMPYVLIVDSPIPNIRKIQNVLEYVIKHNASLLIVASLEQQPMATLIANKVKGNIKVNIIDTPGFGPTRRDTVEDLAFLTGAKVMSEELGDDLDLISPDCLGRAVKAVTDSNNTVLQIGELEVDLSERIAQIEEKIKNETNGYLKKKHEARLAMLNGSVAIVKVAGYSKIELKEKKDRVEDAIYAVKAALKEGIVAGGGSALLYASNKLKPQSIGETILQDAIRAPFKTILSNAGLPMPDDINLGKNMGVDVVSGKTANMVRLGIIDPVLVTKTALKNAVSVATTILSADCVINNMRLDESN